MRSLQKAAHRTGLVYLRPTEYLISLDVTNDVVRTDTLT